MTTVLGEATNAPDGATRPDRPSIVLFKPKRRIKVRWDWIVIGLTLVAAAMLALMGVMILAGNSTAVPGLRLPRTRGMDLLALGFLVGVGPYAIFQGIERHRVLARDARLPDFLTDLASLHKAGLTLPDALITTAQGNYGPLNAVIRQAADQVRWNIPVLTALENLKNSIGTPIAQRILAVVLEAGRTGGNVPEVLDIAAQNCRATVNLREQRRRSMAMYTIITYVASVIFVGVCLALHRIFVPKMIFAFSGASGGGNALGLVPLPSAAEFRTMFYTAGLTQSIGNGLLAGIMSDGRLAAGLKHAWSMVLLCFLGFLVG